MRGGALYLVVGDRLYGLAATEVWMIPMAGMVARALPWSIVGAGPLAELPRGDAGQLLEPLGHVELIGEPALRGNLIEFHIGLFQHLTDLADLDSGQVLAGKQPGRVTTRCQSIEAIGAPV
jgi:hypothetical protein